MNRFLALCSMICCLSCHADVTALDEEDLPEVSSQEIAQDDSDSYDQQYNMNPLPQNPRRQMNPTSCKDMMAQLSTRLDQLESRVDVLEKQVALLQESNANENTPE